MKEELKRFIQQNKLVKVFDELNEIVLDDDVQSMAVLLSSRYNRLQKQRDAGVISIEDEAIEYNRIVASTLRLINDLNESELKPSTKSFHKYNLTTEEIVSKTVSYSLSFLKNKQPFNGYDSKEMGILWEKHIKPFFSNVIKDTHIITGLEQNPNDAKLQAKFEIRLEDALIAENNALKETLQEQIYKIEHASKTEKSRNVHETTVSGNHNMVIQGVNDSNIMINFSNSR